MATTRAVGEYKVEVGTTFQKIMLGLAVLSLFIVAGVQIYTSPKTVTIDSKHWDCTATEPNGIEARCTNFTMKKYSLHTQ